DDDQQEFAAPLDHVPSKCGSYSTHTASPWSYVPRMQRDFYLFNVSRSLSLAENRVKRRVAFNLLVDTGPRNSSLYRNTDI
uniref:Uncharacterized protein n=1 Tax=Cyclopterus lumpus TaxID=8103 RepID=A0A8C2WYN4_CYCLU